MAAFNPVSEEMLRWTLSKRLSHEPVSSFPIPAPSTPGPTARESIRERARAYRDLLATLRVQPRGRSFQGAGVYAIYYRGVFPAYAPITQWNTADWVRPIYVGSAEGSGVRKGTAKPAKSPVANRIRNHARSILWAQQGNTLNIDDFSFRWLNTEVAWIRLAEIYLIRELRPLWNELVDGFGNNPPGTGRAGQQRSAWDTIHPGRYYAEALPSGDDGRAQALFQSIDDWFAQQQEAL